MDFGVASPDDRSVMPYFYIDGCAGHNATMIRARRAVWRGCRRGGIAGF